MANGSHLANHTDIAHEGVCASLRPVCHVAALCATCLVSLVRGLGFSRY